MQRHKGILVYGPAYLDTVIETAGPLLPGEPGVRIDQSLPAIRVVPRDDGQLVICGPAGDRLIFPLPADIAASAATVELAEPVLARLRGAQALPIRGEFSILRYTTQLGGMGAGYTKAFGGLLRTPFGLRDSEVDAIGRAVLNELAQYDVRVAPEYLPDCDSDASLVILTAYGDKLAIGIREAMVRWRMVEDDRALIAKAAALVFCGAPNALTAEALSRRPNCPVMCAPALRNARDTEVPLVSLANHIHYLTLNELEWATCADRERLRRQVPVITVTDGPRGSRVLVRDEEIAIPAIPHPEPADTNRAGETYGATFFKVLLAEAPDFHLTGKVSLSLAERTGQLAARQAWRQLDIRGFDFPSDDWNKGDE